MTDTSGTLDYGTLDGLPATSTAASTYDLSTTIGRARLLVPDRVLTAPIFTDAEYAGFRSVEGSDDPRLMAAAALETMAANLLMTLGDTKVEDLQTNASKTAATMLTRAQALRDQSLQEEMMEGGGFDWAEQVTDPFTRRERLIDQRLRGVV